MQMEFLAYLGPMLGYAKITTDVDKINISIKCLKSRKLDIKFLTNAVKITDQIHNEPFYISMDDNNDCSFKYVVKKQNMLCYKNEIINNLYELVEPNQYTHNLQEYFNKSYDNDFNRNVYIINQFRHEFFINNFEKYQHNKKLFLENINYLHLMIDSGATISLSNHKIAQQLGFKIYTYNKPLTLKFANGQIETCTEFSYFGDVIGVVALIKKCQLTLLSSIQLSKRKIKVSTEYQNIIIKDNDDNIMHIHQYDYKSGPPMIPIRDILNIPSDKFNFIKLHNQQNLNSHLVASNITSMRRKNIPITLEEFRQVIELHKRLCHVDPGVMVQAISSGAWPDVIVKPSHITKVFEHHDCEACVLAKRNDLPINNGSGIRPTQIGQSLSVDRVSLPDGVYGGHTGVYVFVDLAKGYMNGFLDKEYKLIEATKKIILYYKKFGYRTKSILTDAGSVESSKEYESFLSDNEILLVHAGVEAQYQNSVERYIQQLKKLSSTLMYSQQNLSSAYVGFAILCAIQIHNCTPNTLSIPETPWYHLTNKHPNMMDRFRYPFGTAVTIKRTGVSSTSFNTTRNEKGYIIGFTEQPNHATLVYIPTRRGHQKIFTRINAQPIRTSLLANEYVNDEVPEIEINENESLSTNTYNFSSTSTFEPGSPIPEQLRAEVSE
jgi:hypothetical protein